ncbi:hypothetical protein HK102_004446 [Quaeritorhiza haematococci]|nr:hypothetical protein HK102_004446 [Quaeritorhiza haematococci]
MDSFIASHLVTPGTTITHTSHHPSTQTLTIPDEDLDDFYRIYAASIPDHSITEKITATPHFPFFLDVDMNFKHVQENWTSAEEVIMFFHDLFSEVSGMLEELFEMGAVEMVATCRILYKWHVYFTNVIVDKQTAIGLVKRITADRDGLWADIIDDKVYSAGLRMLGSHKGGMAKRGTAKPNGYDDMFPDHPWSEYYRVATIDDTTLQIENDVTEAQVREVALTTYKDLPLTPLTPQGKQELGAKRARFTRNANNANESTGNNGYNDDVDDASAQAIQDYLRQALAELDPDIDPTVCAMKRYDNTGMIQTTLVPQRCVFADCSHTRTLERNSPTHWILFQTTQAFLRCFACKGQYTPLVLPYTEEIKMLFASEETELDVMGVVDFPTHEKVANVIVHLLKHRYAASNSAGTVSSNWGLQFFVFVKEDHRWTAGYDTLVMEIMEEKGAIQTLLSDFVTRTANTLEEDEDKKARWSSWGKLRNQLQSNSYVCNNIMPIVGRKLAWFHTVTVKGVPFANRLDENGDLLGFTNGVYNICSGGFRPGVPEDMVSMTAELAYHDLDEFPAETVQSVTSFLQRVFPVREECVYILQELGLALSG